MLQTPSSAASYAVAAAADTRHEPTEVEETLCYVSARAFRRLWCAILVVYSVVALQLVFLGGFYFLLMHFPSVAYYSALFRLISVDQFPLVVAVYAIMAVLVYSEVVRILSYSVRHRRLCLLNESALQARAIRAATRAAAIRASTTWYSRVQRLWLLYLEVVSVRGPYFDAVMALRELIEILVQVNQAYQLSRLTPNAWLNLCFGGLITVNCLSSPIIERFFHADLGRERMNILLMDLLLDFVWLLLPLMLFPHYIGGFFGGEAVMYEDTFMVRAAMETQLILVTSHYDLFSKILPSLSIFFTIRKIRALVRRREATAPVVAARVDVKPRPTEISPKRRRLTRLTTNMSFGNRTRPRHTTYLVRHMRYLHILQHVLVRVLIALGAFTVLMYVLTAILHGTCEPGCKLVLRPWFVFRRCRCAVQEISCYTRKIEGSESQLRKVFDAMEHPGLQSLILSHCPQLEIPSDIRDFHDMYGLEIYNSTIASWPPTASLRASDFPRLGFVYLLRTHVEALPPGLLQGDLPPSLLEIDVIVSRLATLPDDLHEKWPHVNTVYLDFGAFETPPPVLGNMALESLSLVNNSIRVIPNSTFATSRLSYLVLNGNPLTRLPSSLGNGEALYELQLQQTEIADLKEHAWADGQTLPTRFKIFARNAPVCAGFDAPDSAAGATVASAVAFAVRSGGFTVSCDVRGSLYRGRRSRSYFALDGKTLERTPV